jgi:hypothetical protein
MRLSRLAALALVPVLGTGCATTLATMDTALPTKVKHVRFDYGYGYYIPTGPFYKIIQAGIGVASNLRDGATTLSPEDAQRLYDAGLGLALMPPSAVWEVMLRTGIAEDADIGLKWASTSLRADVKWRFWHAGEQDVGRAHNASIGLGVSRYMFGNPVFEVLDYVKMGDFSRWDFDVPLLYSWHVKEAFTLYTGAKYIYTRFSMDENLYKLQQLVGDFGGPEMTDKITSNMHYGGALIGMMGGYKYAWINLELNVGYVYARPVVYSFVDKAQRPRNVGGVTLFPNIGFVVKI